MIRRRTRRANRIIGTRGRERGRGRGRERGRERERELGDDKYDGGRRIPRVVVVVVVVVIAVKRRWRP
jgi:hypothetical protein